MSSIPPLNYNNINIHAQQIEDKQTTTPPPFVYQSENIHTERKEYLIPTRPSEINGVKEEAEDLRKILLDNLRGMEKEKGEEKKLEPQWTSMRIKVDEETKRIVIQVLNWENQIIRQIPPEEWLRFLTRWQEIQGLLFDEYI